MLLERVHIKIKCTSALHIALSSKSKIWDTAYFRQILTAVALKIFDGVSPPTYFRVSAVASVGASASQRCPLDTRTLVFAKIMLENYADNKIFDFAHLRML